VELKRILHELRDAEHPMFESNQSGIETFSFISAGVMRASFESNQSGIETNEIRRLTDDNLGLNRTRVELKQNGELGISRN